MACPFRQAPRGGSLRPVGAWGLLILVSVFLSGGCITERSIRMRAGDWTRLEYPAMAEAHGSPCTTRDWLRAAAGRVEPLLRPQIRPLVTEDLSTGPGVARDVYAHFDWEPDMLTRLTGNIYGIVDTVQAVGSGTGAPTPAQPWPGFDDVDIELEDGTHLVARIGWAGEPGAPPKAPAIVIIPGLLGDNRILRTRDLATALRDAGFHAVALEQRDHGQTRLRYPDQGYSYGLNESGDLIRLSEWLEAHEQVTETGLVGFCWGANEALITAWYDGVGGVDPLITPELAQSLPGPLGRTHYRAGILAISPVVRFEECMDEIDNVEHGNPLLGYIRRTVKNRMIDLGFPEPSGSLRRLVKLECAGAGYSPSTIEEGLDFLRLWPYMGRPDGDKLEHVRVPVLLLHASNDPISPSQHVADLISTVSNPLVAAYITANGGHGGFGVHNRKHYFSMALNFFDTQAGAAACLARCREGATPP